jgi:hypothetical protein
MDSKKLGKVALILGLLVLAFGAVQWASNSPGKKINRVEGSGLAFEKVWGHDIRSSEKRDNATKILIAGGVITLVGLGLSYSSNKKE